MNLLLLGFILNISYTNDNSESNFNFVHNLSACTFANVFRLGLVRESVKFAYLVFGVWEFSMKLDLNVTFFY